MRNATIADYERLRDHPRYYCRKEAKRWQDAIPVLEQIEDVHNILEVGCGRGSFLRYCDENLPIAMRIGMDVAEHETWRDIDARFIIGNLSAWPLETAMWRIDVVCSFDVMEHLPEDEITAVIKAMTMRTKRHMLHAIYNGPDVWDIDGEQVEMHLTQRPAEWWVDRFRRFTGGAVSILPVTHKPQRRFLVRVDL